MKLLYASDYESQKDIPLSFYDFQRKRFQNHEKDNDFDHGFLERHKEEREKNLKLMKIKNKIKKVKSKYEHTN